MRTGLADRTTQRRKVWQNLFATHFSGIEIAVVAGFLLRVASILLLHTYRFRPTEDYFAFGFETGRVARAIALGQGFSNPFHGITGSTAWEAPLYPYLLGGVFKMAGVYTQLSAFVILTVNSLFSALTVLPVWLIARKVFGPRVAMWSAWVWALAPFAIYWPTRWPWETSLTALLLTTAFWLALSLADAEGRKVWKLWLWFGLLWGVIALSNPSCLSFLPFAGTWACRQLARRNQRWLKPAIASALVFFAVIAPWEARDYVVFHKVLPIRSNAGAELRLGNAADAAGVWMSWLHPTQNVLELEEYKQMGEMAYVHAREEEALEFMRRHPGFTAVLCLRKLAYFWAGLPRLSRIPFLAQTKNLVFLASSVLAWWGLGLLLLRRERGAALFAMLLLVYPASFYITFPQPRYRHPIEPVMIILTVYLLLQTRELRRHEVPD